MDQTPKILTHGRVLSQWIEATAPPPSIGCYAQFQYLTATKEILKKLGMDITIRDSKFAVVNPDADITQDQYEASKASIEKL